MTLDTSTRLIVIGNSPHAPLLAPHRRAAIAKRRRERSGDDTRERSVKASSSHLVGDPISPFTATCMMPES